MDEKQGRQDAMISYSLARVQAGLERLEPLLRLGRALADPMRIRILVLLAQRYSKDTENLESSMYGQEIAEALEVTPPTISHHLAMLKGAGLIQVQRKNSYHFYALNPDGLQQFASNLTVEHLRAIGTAFPAHDSFEQPPEEENRKMFQDAYIQEGRLLSWPQGVQARRFVMEKIAEAFEWGRIYEEREVNALLKAIYPEPATLRRELIDQKLLMRDHGRYWLMRPPAVQ